MYKDREKRQERREERQVRRADKKAARAEGSKVRYKKASKYSDYFNEDAEKAEPKEKPETTEYLGADLFKYKGLGRTARYFANEGKSERKAAIASAKAFRKSKMS